MDYQQSFENNQFIGENNPYSNILVNQLSPVSTGYIQTIPLYSNAVVPQLSLYNQNKVQLEPISYANNSYLYTLQNTNYNPTNYLITPQPQKLSYNTTDNGLRTSYPYNIPIYNMQPTSVLVNSGYAYNNINTQYMNTPATPLAIPVQIVPNYRTSLLLQNGYVTNYNNPQLQNVVAYPNRFYLQNQQFNVLPYETNSYEPEEVNTDTNKLISNYNIVNTSEPVKQITYQTYENAVNTINYSDNVSPNSVGSEFYSTTNIGPEYQVQSMPIPNQPYQKLSLPPTVIIPKSNEDYTQIKKKRYAQKVKPLTKKREKVVIPAYEKYIPIIERASIREKGNDYIQTQDNISNIENKVTSQQENNYIPYTENKYASGQNNNYIPNVENIIISEQSNNYIQNTENPTISEQNNNYIPNTENIVIAENNNNYIPSNENLVISEQNNNYYIPSNENLVISEQNNNNIQNTENLVISGQSNNYITNNQNIALSSQENNNIPNNQNIIISEQNNNYIPNNQNIIISEKESNYSKRNIYIPNNENFVLAEQESNYIPNNENIIISDQNNNYLPNDENNVVPQKNNYYDNNAISGRKNIYVPKIEKVIISDQENNYVPNTTNNIISEQNNNYIPNIEIDDLTAEENNYLPTNDNAIISGRDNAYNHTPNKMKVENTVLPPRKSFIQKPLSFKIPKKLSRRLDYNSVGVRATSPLYFSGDTTANLAPLSPVRTPLEPSKEN